MIFHLFFLLAYFFFLFLYVSFSLQCLAYLSQLLSNIGHSITHIPISVAVCCLAFGYCSIFVLHSYFHLYLHFDNKIMRSKYFGAIPSISSVNSHAFFSKIKLIQLPLYKYFIFHLIISTNSI